jgi:hypothetical protein
MTSVDFLAEKLEKFIPSGDQLAVGAILEQAKEMERQEKIKAQIEILRECGYDERDSILNRLLNQLAK